MRTQAGFWMVVVAAMAALTTNRIEGQEEPAELTEMRAQFEKAKVEAMKPLQRSYGQALRQKMTELTQAGKLEEALAFQNEMNAVAAELLADAPVGPGAGWAPGARRNVVDFLGIIDTGLDGKPADKWQMVDGKLSCVRGSMVPKIILPYEPPEEFDMTMTFAQPRFRNGLSLLIPNVAGGIFSVTAADQGGSRVVLSVGGEFSPEYSQSKPGWFDPDKEYTLTVEVREKSVTAKVDGKEIFKYEGDRAALETNVWFKHPEVTKLAISADDPAVISKLEVVEVKGTGKLLRKK